MSVSTGRVARSQRQAHVQRPLDLGLVAWSLEPPLAIKVPPPFGPL